MLDFFLLPSSCFSSSQNPSLTLATSWSSCVSCVYVEILSTWEVWRALKRLELHSAAPHATLTPLSCSPNFPRAQHLDIPTLTHELIVNQRVSPPFPTILLYYYLLIHKTQNSTFCEGTDRNSWICVGYRDPRILLSGTFYKTFYTTTRADQLEHATPILSLCHGIFTDWSIFSIPFLFYNKCSSAPVMHWRQWVSCDCHGTPTGVLFEGNSI